MRANSNYISLVLKNEILKLIRKSKKSDLGTFSVLDILISSKEEFYKLGGKREEIFKKLHIDANSMLSNIKN